MLVVFAELGVDNANDYMGPWVKLVSEPCTRIG